MKERYQPSQEEIKKAEIMMGPAEKALSEMKKTHLQKMDESGKEGFLNKSHYRVDKNHFKDRTEETTREGIHGTINGHDIQVGLDIKEIQKHGNGDKTTKREIVAYVDKKRIDEVDAQKLYDKYWGIAYDTTLEKEILKEQAVDIKKQAADIKESTEKENYEKLLTEIL